MSLSKPRKLEPEAARDPARVRNAALRLLTRREHSERELKDKLAARGYAAEAVAGVLAALAAKNLLSDTRFVEEFVAARVRRGDGPAKIRDALRGKGVDAEPLEAALAAHHQEWPALAESVRRKRFGAARPQSFAERARQARFLQQRGFTAEQIRTVLKGDIEGEN